jgi:hypothetical protein
MRVLPSLLLAALTVSSAAGPIRAAEPPDNVVAAVADVERECRDMDGKPDSDAVLSVKDVNGDGGEDWVADYAKLKCEGGINPMCGADGCALQIYLWNGSTAWTLAFDEMVQRYQFTKTAGKPALKVTLAGAACDKPGARSCTVTYRLGRNAVAPAR